MGKPLDCHQRALHLLSVRARSRRELQTRLLRAGFERLEVEDELSRLGAVGLIDDDAFARQVAEHELVVRRSGVRAVTSRLAAKGIDRQTIDRVLEGGARAGEDERAHELARARARRLESLPPERAFSRLVAYLARRGYDAGTAREAARAALAAAGED